ncbi:PRELI-like family-domain-containing protein [Daldinia vernicosa]|uniref:PRELI-like family-domain-containing protein n=1 Tax=Daldinia vernicosa TaxID=114800 RepID=UPI002007FEB1|nr:PRELI-like family-domain-containing protein [Daldinia vernicosa]KAI0847371.1 PRELI-like family-domain-containing protein [Daldinia vernicosa]
MVLTHTTNHTYSHPFPTVTLAFFLRYYSPRLNPFSSHVLSSDTISSHVDPQTGRLHTTRIHMKKTRLPSAVVKLLPSSVTGGGGDKSSYVLETSVVDIKEGWMKTESRNLNYTGVLSVVEEQRYSTTPPDQATSSSLSGSGTVGSSRTLAPNTFVTTTFSYRSTLGGKKHEKAAAESTDGNEESGTRRFGDWISGWGAKRIQSSIESIASNKTDDQILKSRDGMRIVLERLRSNGVVAVLRELRRREGNVFEQ